MHRSSHLYCLGIALLLLLRAVPASAQACPPPTPFGICGLDGSHSFTYDDGSSSLLEVIDLQTVSYKESGKDKARRFDVQVTQTYPVPFSATTYSLAPDNSVGEQLAISLSLEQLFGGGLSAQLTPNSNSQFTGSLQAEPAQLRVDVSAGQPLDDTSYSGSFSMQLQQQGGTTTDVYFTLTVSVEPSIGIYNLPASMDLTNPNALTGGNFEGTADFCVGGRGFASYSVQLASEHGSTGGAGAAPYELAGLTAPDERLPYTAQFNATPGTLPGTFERLADESCAANNASITVSVAQTAWQEARQRDYADTLTITVTAE